MTFFVHNKKRKQKVSKMWQIEKKTTFRYFSHNFLEFHVKIESFFKMIILDGGY
jgi:hypothetical protein